MKISVVGVFAGSVVGLVALVIGCMPFALFWTHELNSQRLSVSAPARLIYCAMVVVCLASFALGGYVAAAIAKRDEPLNGALSSYLLVCTVIANYILNVGTDPQWAQSVLLIAGPLLAFLGGDLRHRRRLARERFGHPTPRSE